MRFLLACALLALLAANVQLGAPKRRTKKVNVAAAFEAANITNFTTPQNYLGVTFEKNIIVNLGNEIYPGKTGNPPTIQYNSYPGYYYTLVLIDKDFPSADDPYLSPSLRALWVNIKNSDLQSANVVAQYVPVTPPPATGFHDAVFYLYKQKALIDAESISYLNFVLSIFDLEGFVRENDLCLVAGNFYSTQFPDNKTACAGICQNQKY